MKKFLYAWLAIAISSITFYSCSNTIDNTITPIYQTNTIKVGALFSYTTGDWSTLGKTSKSALGIAETKINAYLASINSNNSLSISYSDTYLNPDSALAQVRRFYASGTRIILGPQSSSEVAKIKSFVDSAGMVVISQGSTAGSLSIPGDNIFRFCPVDSMEAKASVALMNYDTVKYLVTVFRGDLGNSALNASVSGNFLSSVSGGVLADEIMYGTTTTNFAPIVAQIKTKILAAPPEKKVGIYLAAFDENVQIFNTAMSDPVLSSVKWYGSDGVVQSAVLTANTTASQFASTVKYDCPIFGLNAKASPITDPLASQILSATGIQADAFTFAAYDAIWVAALAGDNVPTFSTTAYKTALVQNANSYFGASGWTALNASGDRAYANFDFWGVRLISGTYKWKIVSRYNSNTGQIEIVE